MDIDLEELAMLVELLKSADFSEFRYEKGDLSLVVRRGPVAADDAPGVARAPAQATERAQAPAVAPSVAAPAAPAAPAPASPAPVAGKAVCAPLLGTFYSRPRPGEPPFVRIGDRVEVDTVVGIVEVMKLMNSVDAGCQGIVVAIHAGDGQLVEFGQPLLSIEPDQP